MLPIKFHPVDSRDLLVMLGYECEHVRANWADVGTAETGPRLEGHDAYDIWRKGDHSIVVMNGEIIETFTEEAV